LLSIFLYQCLCKLEIDGNDLVENQYCVAFLPVNLGFGQGVGSDSLHIKAKTLHFKYFT